MKTLIFSSFTLFCTLICATPSQANSVAYWQPILEQNRQTTQTIRANRTYRNAQHLIGNVQMMRDLLNSDTPVLSLPMPDGTIREFHFTTSNTMAAPLAAAYPEIMTYQAYDIAQPENRGRFDITPQGFHGMFSYQGKWAYIDPVENEDQRYITYYRSDAQRTDLRLADRVRYNLQAARKQPQSASAARPIHGTQIRTFRLAMGVTGEYTLFHGGSVSDAMSAITTVVNRLNEVYERDLAVNFELIANNDQLIYTNPSTDPFRNDDGDIDRFNNLLNNTLADSSYDIGHLLFTGGGGIAGLGVICESGLKADGVSGDPNPIGDSFTVDYVAHEIGHQFGAEHTFNGTAGACGGGNRISQAAWEPGSGSTIMSYAGICDGQNLQSNSDAQFNIGSIQQILSTFAAKGSGLCGTVRQVSNNIPDVNAGANYTVPARTPLILTGTGSDADNDPLLYSWEQQDTGTSSNSATMGVDNGSRPLFRSLPITSSPIRYIPALDDVLADRLSTGETYATTNRELNFSLTARDGKSGLATDEMVINVTTSAGPFAVNSPTSGSSWANGSTATVTWSVANTNQSPVNCQNIDILVSSNGGSTFNNTLASGVTNDGSHSFTVNTPATSSARLMVKCSNNIFYAVNNGSFSITGSSTNTGDNGNTSDTATNQVQEVYLAYYGRPGDPAGLDFWVSSLNNNSGNLDAIINQFGTSNEYTTRFGNQSNTALINNIYQSLYGRDADSAGLSFYQSRLNSGVPLAEIALQILNGAQQNDAAIISNKVEVSNYFTGRVRSAGASYTLDDIDTIRNIIAGVDTTTGSVNTAESQIDSWINDQTQ